MTRTTKDVCDGYRYNRERDVVMLAALKNVGFVQFTGQAIPGVVRVLRKTPGIGRGKSFGYLVEFDSSKSDVFRFLPKFAEMQTWQEAINDIRNETDIEMSKEAIKKSLKLVFGNQVEHLTESSSPKKEARQEIESFSNNPFAGLKL